MIVCCLHDSVQHKQNSPFNYVKYSLQTLKETPQTSDWNAHYNFCLEGGKKILRRNHKNVIHVFVSCLASDWRIWDKMKHKRFHKVKSIAMQDDSLHYGIIQGWTKPVRSGSLFLCHSWLITCCTCIGVLARPVPGVGSPVLCLAYYSYQKVFRYILGGFVLLSALNFLLQFYLSLHINTTSSFI